MSHVAKALILSVTLLFSGVAWGQITADTDPAVTKIDGKISEYEVDFKDASKVLIGGRDVLSNNKFLPEVELTKGEEYLRITAADIIVTTERETLSSDKLSLEVGGVTHRFYRVSIPLEYEDHTRYDEGIEWERVYTSLPASGEVTFDIDFSPGMAFHYQPELTVDEQLDADRPEAIVGSYAIYTNNDQIKFGYLYAPHLTDATGKKIKIPMELDPEKKTLVFLLDLKWMQAATYPVTLGGTKLGKDTGTGTNLNIIDDYVFMFGVGVAASSGAIDNLAFYNNNANSVVGKLILYEDDDSDDEPDDLIEYTAEDTFAANNWNVWGDAGGGALQNSASVVSGTRYFVALWNDTNDLACLYDSVAGFDIWYNSETYSDTTPLDPIDTASGGSAEYKTGYKVAAYVEYTAAAAGDAAQVIRVNMF